MKGNMPTQPVYDLKIHERDGDLVVATHGRGIYITNIAALEQVNDKVLGESFYLFDVKPAVKWVTRTGNVSASRNFSAPSAPGGRRHQLLPEGGGGGRREGPDHEGGPRGGREPEGAERGRPQHAGLEHADGQRRAAGRDGAGRRRAAAAAAACAVARRPPRSRRSAARCRPTPASTPWSSRQAGGRSRRQRSSSRTSGSIGCSRETKPESRIQKTEDRRQKIEDRR